MDFSRYPHIQAHEQAVAWLTFESNRGLAENTLQAYARGLEDFFRFCVTQGLEIMAVGRDAIGWYIHEMRQRPIPDNVRRSAYKRAYGLTNSTMSQRLTTIRRFYDYLEEDGLIEQNPVRRGRYLHGNPRGGERGLIPTMKDFPWIPNQEQWQQIMEYLQTQKLRDKLMFALSYDAALRREEVCGLHIEDFDFAHRLLTVRAENTKSRRARTVPYTEGSGQLLRLYLRERAQISRQPGPLFLSVSPRNYGQPISLSIWSKTMRDIAEQSGVPQLTPHTLRHLRLTDLARAGVDMHDIATFAGHQSMETTMLYVHLSGTELAERIGARLQQLDTWRLNRLLEANHEDL